MGLIARVSKPRRILGYMIAFLLVASLGAVLFWGDAAVVPSAVVVFTVLTTGPVAVFIPGVFEPVLVYAGSLHTPTIVALAAAVPSVVMEAVNWHVFSWLGQKNGALKLPQKPLVRCALRWFARWPFATVALIALSPIPFFVARCLALWSGYRLSLFLAAFLMGRFPRFLLLAYLGSGSGMPEELWLILALLFLGAAGLFWLLKSTQMRPRVLARR